MSQILLLGFIDYCVINDQSHSQQELMPIERLSVDPAATSMLDGELSDKAMECFAFNISQTKSVMLMHDNPTQGARLNSTEN